MLRDFLKIDINNPLKFLSAGNFVSDDENWIHKRRTMDHFVLILGLNNCLYIQQESEPYEVQPNNTLLLFPNKLHWGYQKSLKNLSYYWCHFNIYSEYKQVTENEFLNDALLHENSENSSNIYIPTFSSFNNIDRIKILFHQLLHATNMNYCSKYKADYLLTSLAIEMSEQCVSKYHDQLLYGYEDSKFNKILEWIRININKSLTITQLANIFSYNPDYLSRIFKIKTGQNFKEYVYSMKLMKIKDLLTNTDMNIKEIAYSLGFNDEKYMMRLFKKHENMTPSQYRNAYCYTHLNNQ